MKNENKKMADIRHSVSQKTRPVQSSPQLKPTQTANLANQPSRSLVRKPVKNMDVARSSSISHFSPRPQSLSPANSIKRVQEFMKRPVQKPAEVKHIAHPLVQNIQTKPVVDTSAKSIKEAAIAEAFEKIAERQKKEKEAIKKRNRTFQIILAIVAVIGIIGYFVLVNLPSISVSFASVKSGIQASFPNFCPEGFKHKGPAYIKGSEVVIDFVSNNKDVAFSLSQSKSTWDSSAVKNMVEEKSNGEYKETEESGLTIFSYGGNAAWVNGGILYTISGDAELNIGDIRQIALSL